MEAFDYAALKADGKKVRGTIMAATAREARELLRARSLTPTELAAATSRRRLDILKRTPKVSAKDKTRAARQLAVLVKAGQPIEKALNEVARQMEDSPLRAELLDVRARVFEGESLSSAMAAHPKVFDGTFVAMVAAGEVSGNLPEVLDRIAEDMEQAEAMRRTIIGAMVYPILLTILAVAVVIGLMVILVPKVAEQFAAFGQELPPLTQFVIGLSDFIAAFWLWILAVIVAGVFGARYLLKRPKARLAKDRFMLRVPLLGGLIRKINAARFSRVLAGLLQSGTPALSGLNIARGSLTNRVMYRAAEIATDRVREGQAVGPALKATSVFPALMVQMVSGGEASDDIGPMFEIAADYLDREVKATLEVLLSLLAPVIIIFLAGFIMLIFAAIFLPMLQLNTLQF